MLANVPVMVQSRMLTLSTCVIKILIQFQFYQSCPQLAADYANLLTKLFNSNNLNNLKPKTHNAGKQLSMIMMVNQISHLLYTIEVRISDSDMGLVSA